MDTLIPTIAHAVRHPIHRDRELTLYIERPKAEKAVGFFGGVLIDLVDRAEHERVVQELNRQCDELAARLEAAEAPVLEVRACGCSQAKAGRCVMGDYGALPIGTQLYTGAAPERAEPTDIEAVLRNAVDRAVDQCANATGQRAKIATFVNRTDIVNAAIAQIRGDAPTCSSSGLLGATSGVGRECGMWIEGMCTSPQPCQHQQRPCRCGPDGCSDSVACPRKGGAA